VKPVQEVSLAWIGSSKRDLILKRLKVAEKLAQEMRDE
jgi:hypothetical protein